MTPTTKMPDHEIERLERSIRKATKRGGGWTKGVSKPDKDAAKAAMKKLGRTKPEWDKSIDLGMICEKSKVVPKKSFNSID